MRPQIKPSHFPTILAVDDDRTTLLMLEEMLRANGYAVLTARTGEEALQVLKLNAGRIDSILLDRIMPGMDGLEVVTRLKQDPVLRQIPVVMQTGSDSPEQVRERIDAGVFYYLTKPVQDSVLKSVLAASLRERQQRRDLQAMQLQQSAGFHLIESLRMQYRTLPEAEGVAVFLAQCFPDPERTAAGLMELLTNAVEHGNLGIGYEEKTRLIEQGNWREEVLRRAELAPNLGKKVEVLLQIKPEGTYVQITDEGAGFDWKSYLTIDPSRTGHSHGRGIAQANAQSFDALRYNERGNQLLAAVYANKSRSQVLEW